MNLKIKRYFFRTGDGIVYQCNARRISEAKRKYEAVVGYRDNDYELFIDNGDGKRKKILK